jgi:hypothetical protein
MDEIAFRGSTPRAHLALIAKYKGWEWDGFIREMGLEKINVYQYYLGSVPSKLTQDKEEKMITGLFNDMITIGALKLPSFCKAEDFSFQVGGGNWGIFLKGTGQAIETISKELHVDTRMGFPEIANLPMMISNAINRLLSEVK